jgi:hypothetical protein
MPVKDAEFIAWAKTIYRDCAENSGIWMLDPNLLNQFHDLVSAANSAYESNADEKIVTAVLKNGLCLSLKEAVVELLNIGYIHHTVVLEHL